MTRKHVFLTVAAAAALAAAAPARSEDPPAPQPLLPDLRQFVPANVKAQSVSGEWRLGFDSEVGNDGPGYLKIRGTGPGGGPMTADQVLQMDDGGETTVPGIGTMHYVVSPGHQHWHLLDFERYELRSADSAQTLVTDQKTGFCLADAFTSDQCGRNHPEYTSVEEGLDPDGSDRYISLLEGQYLVLSQATVPDGDYLLVHRANPTGALQVTNPGNDAATLRLSIVWQSGQPHVSITNSCAASTTCAAPLKPPPPPPDPQPSPQPAPDPTPVAPGPGLPAPEPQPVPILPPTSEPTVASRVSMSREMAVRLARQAIRKSSKQTPRQLRMICGRKERAAFSCHGTWHGTRAGVWTGSVRVWYRLRRGQLSWFYDLSAERRPDGKHLRTRATRGSASAAMFTAADGSLICRGIDAS